LNLPAFPNQGQTQIGELPEFPMTGPFGGVQSEMPDSMIEKYGFKDVQNVLFRLGKIQARPTYQTIPYTNPTNVFGPVAMGDFFDLNGVRAQYLFFLSPVGLGGTVNPYYYNTVANNFQPLTGAALPSSSSVATAILNNKLCFAVISPNGTPVSQIYLYDNQSTTYTLSSANSPQPTLMFELATHLMTANIVPAGGGQRQTQTYIWSGAGDPTDWTSFSSGQNNLLNDLGPAVGGVKLGTQGFGYHIKGVMQIIPTGNGAAPFAFQPVMNARMCGLYCPRTLDKFILQGVECSIYVGPDNVYVFNQSSLMPIGDAPAQGRVRLGARQRIFADILAATPPGGPFAFTTTTLNGVPFNAYWLFCPSATNFVCWVFNFDEFNWTRLVFNQKPTCAGSFVYSSAGVGQQIGDPQETIGIGFFNTQNQNAVGYIDFNQPPSETLAYVTSGDHIFDDRRHKHSIKKFRLAATDNGAVTYTITMTNESGVSVNQSVATGGANDGKDSTYIIPFSITGLRVFWQITAPAGSPVAIVEFAPIYDYSGEQRSGTVDGN
jgi:hypothetical protein